MCFNCLSYFAGVSSCNWSNCEIQKTIECRYPAIQGIVDRLEIGFGKIGLPLRVALTGNTASPALDQTLMLIGQEQVVSRLDAAIDYIVNKTSDT